MSSTLLGLYACLNEESTALCVKIKAMSEFMSNPLMKQLELEDRILLRTQLIQMKEYEDTLQQRMFLMEEKLKL